MPELLEIREAGGAFARIEEWLTGQGFFGSSGDDLVADVYLAYGLSQSIRRNASSLPPEPCPALPLAACMLRDTRTTQPPTRSLAIGEWE